MYLSFGKRFLDVLASLLALPFLMIIFVITAILIKVEDGGPVFFNAPRLGKGGSPFKMYKFRSMQVNAPDIRLSDGSTYNAEDDPRVTQIGKFLRKSSIDELPQFLNVLIGTMSLVGPRPDPVDWLERYSDEDKKLLFVLPGITGYNQAFFRNSSDGETKTKNDVFYAENVSFLFDVKILLKTVAVVFLKENLYIDPERTEATRNTKH